MEYQNYQQPVPQNNYQQPAPQNDGALGWDDEIQKEESFVLLPEGDYRFTVVKLDKGRHDGSAKISACPKAIVDFSVTAPDGTVTTITENFLLHKKMEWKLSQFFASIGMKQKDEKLRMNWSPALIGKTGICKIIVHEYKGNDNQMHKKNQIEKLYPSYDQPNLPPPVQPQQSYSAPPQQSYPAPPPAYQQPAYTPPQQGYQPPAGGWNGSNQ